MKPRSLDSAFESYLMPTPSPTASPAMTKKLHKTGKSPKAKRNISLAFSTKRNAVKSRSNNHLSTAPRPGIVQITSTKGQGTEKENTSPCVRASTPRETKAVGIRSRPAGLSPRHIPTKHDQHNCHQRTGDNSLPNGSLQQGKRNKPVSIFDENLSGESSDVIFSNSEKSGHVEGGPSILNVHTHTRTKKTDMECDEDVDSDPESYSSSENSLDAVFGWGESSSSDSKFHPHDQPQLSPATLANTDKQKSFSFVTGGSFAKRHFY